MSILWKLIKLYAVGLVTSYVIQYIRDNRWRLEKIRFTIHI